MSRRKLTFGKQNPASGQALPDHGTNRLVAYKNFEAHQAYHLGGTVDVFIVQVVVVNDGFVNPFPCCLKSMDVLMEDAILIDYFPKNMEDWIEAYLSFDGQEGFF